MRVVELNMCNFGSTGRIMLSVADEIRKEKGEAVCFSAPMFSVHKGHKENIHGHIYFSSQFESNIHYILGRITARNGCYSYHATRRLVKKIEQYNPDIIHLHNLHGFNINLSVLFSYIKKSGTPVVWTLHDCWPFTGHCAHFLISRCDKWKTQCDNCKYYKSYPKTTFDNSRYMYQLKKKLFTGISNMTIVTPSSWLSELVRQSFLKEYPVRVINNGINLSVFKPTESNVRDYYGCKDKYIILGVSFSWGYSKGLDVFIKLANSLPTHYQIILVGTTDEIDSQLPNNIISIHRTSSQKELAELYSAADVFVNPTREDNFPTVNIESLACGTPVITYNTGGSPEIIDKTCGIVIPDNEFDTLVKAVLHCEQNKPFTEIACFERAKQFEENKQVRKYVTLFQEMTNTKI